MNSYFSTLLVRLVLFAIAIFSSNARASLIPVFDKDGSDIAAGIFRYDMTYDVNSGWPGALYPGSSMQLMMGDFCNGPCIGVVAGAAAPADWSISISYPVAVFTYHGPVLNNSTTFSDFSITTNRADTVEPRYYIFQALNNDGEVIGFTGLVNSPVLAPEPGSLAMVGGAVLSSLIVFSRRRRQ